MRVLSLVLLCSVLFFGWMTGHPHGSDFKISCNVCHSPEGWKLDREIYSFDHNATRLPLNGQHASAECRLCHPTLIFAEAKAECIECHTDVHQATTGSDCARCHTPVSWLVPNITELHQVSRFPLLGAHRTADCYSCHKSESMVRFDVQGVECIDCHRQDYQATTTPNHAEAGFPEDCTGCHKINAFQWEGAGFNHGFFPLTLGHAIPVCADCHTGGDYSSTPTECFACHQDDYNGTTNPSHTSLNFSTQCSQCHTTNPDWQPASYTQHDALSFPIYSGRHKGEWTTCAQCHANPSNYSQFSCITCHEHNKADMDNEHDGENGYSYESSACLNCHPRGEAD